MLFFGTKVNDELEVCKPKKLGKFIKPFKKRTLFTIDIKEFKHKNMPQESQLKKRLTQMSELKVLPEFENLYYDIARDLGMINSWMCDEIFKIQSKKQQIKNENPKASVAFLEREFEQTEEYKDHKKYKYEVEGLSKMMAGIRVKVESLKAESKGQY